MRHKKGFTLTELLVASTIIGMVLVSLIGYMIGAGKATKKIKQGIDRFNLAQSVLVELQSWDYKGSGAKTLTYLKEYLADNNNDFLKYLKKLADAGDPTGKLYNIKTLGGNLYVLDDVTNSTFKIEVILEYAQEDVADLDDDDITSELVYSSTDQGIMRIVVKVAQWYENVDNSNAIWAIAMGYKGTTMTLPSISIIVNDPSDDSLDMTDSDTMLLGVDFRATADMDSGLSALKNMHVFDTDDTDQNGDGKNNYKTGGFWEADSDNKDNDNDGVVDNACEQESVDTSNKADTNGILRNFYDLKIFSSEAFTLSAVTIDPAINGETNLLPWFVEKTGSGKKVYITSANKMLQVYKNLKNGTMTVNTDYTITVAAKTISSNPSGGYGLSCSTTFVIDTISPVVRDISPAPGTFVRNSTVRLGVNAADSSDHTSGLERIYVLERKNLTNGKYTWELKNHELIDPQTSTFYDGALNAIINIKSVTEGWHYYRVVVRDRAGNAGYAETSVYVTHETEADNPGTKTGTGTTVTGVPAGVSLPGTESSESYGFPMIKMLLPYNMAEEIKYIQNNSFLSSSYGTMSNPIETYNISSPISILLTDSDVQDGVESQSGIDVDKENGWPKVFYKTYKSTDIIDASIWTANSDTLTDATAIAAYIKYNVNNVILQFIPVYGDDFYSMWVGVKTKDLAGNISVREFYIRKATASVINSMTEISNLSVLQLANHPNLIPPYQYNPNWTSTQTNNQTNRNFFVGFAGADPDGIKTVKICYTPVFSLDASYNASNNVTKTIVVDKTDYFADNFGIVLTELNLSAPGKFYYYIEVIDSKDVSTYYYNVLVTIPYYRVSEGASLETSKVVTIPMVSSTAPGTTLTDVKSKWVCVPVSQVRVLVLDMDSAESGVTDNIQPFYTDPNSALYWISGSSDFTVAEVPQNATLEILSKLVDKNLNGIFDDYDLVLMYTGETSGPVGLNEDVVMELHRLFMSPSGSDPYRLHDLGVFYPNYDPLNPSANISVSPYYTSTNPPRVAFIGKQFFASKNDGSSALSLWEAFAARWAGIDPSYRESYDFSDSPYVVSNLKKAYDVSSSYKLNDPIYAHFIGQVISVWNTDGTLNISSTESNRDTLSKYPKKLLVTSVSGSFYDGLYGSQTSPYFIKPFMRKLLGETFTSSHKVQPASTVSTGSPVNLDGLVINPSVHSPSPSWTGYRDNYRYAARWSLLWGKGVGEDTADSMKYTAGSWVYTGRQLSGPSSEWIFSINDVNPDKINTKTLYLGFGIETVSTETDRYVMMKRLVRFLYF